MQNIFKDEDGNKGNSITDKLIIEVLQLLKLVAVIAKRVGKDVMG